jgi:hypothetical protein
LVLNKMTTIQEISGSPSLAATFFRALGTGGKRPGLVKTLSKVELAIPSVTLDAQHIASYAALTGFSASQGVPLIYPQMLTFPLVTAYICSDACPWPAMGTVHLANSIEQYKSLRAGDTVRVEMGTGQLFAHEKGQGFTLDLRILRDGELVWSATQSLLRVGVKQTSGQPFTSRLASDTALSCPSVEFKTSAASTHGASLKYATKRAFARICATTQLQPHSLFCFSCPLQHSLRAIPSLQPGDAHRHAARPGRPLQPARRAPGRSGRRRGHEALARLQPGARVRAVHHAGPRNPGL